MEDQGLAVFSREQPGAPLWELDSRRALDLCIFMWGGLPHSMLVDHASKLQSYRAESSLDEIWRVDKENQEMVEVSGESSGQEVGRSEMGKKGWG